jgi:hypothetical protein
MLVQNSSPLGSQVGDAVVEIHVEAQEADVPVYGALILYGETAEKDRILLTEETFPNGKAKKQKILLENVVFEGAKLPEHKLVFSPDKKIRKQYQVNTKPGIPSLTAEGGVLVSFKCSVSKDWELEPNPRPRPDEEGDDEDEGDDWDEEDPTAAAR